MMNLADVLTLKFPNADFTTDILLQDDSDGNGPYIREWNMPIPRPSDDDIKQWTAELDLAYRQKLAATQRIYPPITEQLDMMYRDQRDGTTTWADTIAAVKLAHPKPEK